ncbi:MAG: hypothetical protein AUK64_264 [bacterium P201]|nr:MAG: hypothetical protein AUK64_264 [bacterium P201]
MIGVLSASNSYLPRRSRISISTNSSKVALVQEHHEARHTNLTGEQDVLTGLRHGTVGGGDNDDSTVHLSSTGNHVLHIVSVAGAVDVSVVTLLSLILDVSRIDGDTSLLLFRSGVDGVEALHF